MSNRPGRWSFLTVAIFVIFAIASPARSAGPEDAPAKAPGSDASLTHAAAKATTFKMGAFAVNMVVFSAGTGSVVGGTLLTIFNVSKSWGLFTANDYLWDRYFPTEANKDSGQSFDAKASFWRNTGKFLTYKPVDTIIKFASIYLYTGSAAVMLVYGSASSILNTGVFYGNNFAWDLYDWWSSPAAWRETPGPAQKRLALQP
jgi:uncharacterized membrane protein